MISVFPDNDPEFPAHYTGLPRYRELLIDGTKAATIALLGVTEEMPDLSQRAIAHLEIGMNIASGGLAAMMLTGAPSEVLADVLDCLVDSLPEDARQNFEEIIARRAKQ